MTREKFIKTKIKDMGLKLNFVAEKLGITPNGLNKKLKGETDFWANEIAELKDILKISDEDASKIFFTKKGDCNSH